MPELISSHSNPLIKQLRALRQKKARDESGLFLVEGIHHVGEALEAGWEVQTLVYAPGLLEGDFARRLLEDASRRGVRVVVTTPDIFTSLAEKDNPQGLLAVVRQRFASLDGLTPSKSFRGVACVSPQDPGNVGTILRSLDAAGADALFLLEGGVEPFHPSAVRASMGTIFWKPLVRASFVDFLAWCKIHGCCLAGSSAHAGRDYRQFRPPEGPLVLLLGSEQKGLSAEHLAACDAALSLPMRGRASSLNLAVAAGILLYALGEPA